MLEFITQIQSSDLNGNETKNSTNRKHKSHCISAKYMGLYLNPEIIYIKLFCNTLNDCGEQFQSQNINAYILLIHARLSKNSN